MNKLKKMSLVLTIITLLGIICSLKTYAALGGSVSLTASSDAVVRGGEVSVYIKISSLQADKGIVAYGGVLTYDTNSLQFKDIQGESDWGKPFYKTANGKISAIKQERVKASETVAKITFTVKENAGNSAWVKINNFEISDGDEEKGIGGNNITINIKNKETGGSGEGQKPEGNKPSGEGAGSSNGSGSNGGSGSNNGSGSNDGSQNTGNSGNSGNSGNNGGSQNGNTNKPSTGTNSGSNSNRKPSGSSEQGNVNNENRGEDEQSNNENNENNQNEEQNQITNTVNGNIDNTVQNNLDKKENTVQNELKFKKQENKSNMMYVVGGVGLAIVSVLVFFIVKYIIMLKKA